jgi:hypothetical protein
VRSQRDCFFKKETNLRLTLFCAGVALVIGLTGCSGAAGSSSGLALGRHQHMHIVPIGMH